MRFLSSAVCSSPVYHFFVAETHKIGSFRCFNVSEKLLAKVIPDNTFFHLSYQQIRKLAFQIHLCSRNALSVWAIFLKFPDSSALRSQKVWTLCFDTLINASNKCFEYTFQLNVSDKRWQETSWTRNIQTREKCPLVHLASVPHFGRLCPGCRTAEKQSPQGFSVKGKQRPEIAEASEGRRSGNGQQNEDYADKEAGQSAKPCSQD